MIAEANPAAALADFYTGELNAYVDKLLPITLSNEEYTNRISALCVALNRELARISSTSASVHECPHDEMVDLIAKQFCRNYARCIEAIQGEGATRQ